jgi:hypothetical protein
MPRLFRTSRRGERQAGLAGRRGRERGAVEVRTRIQHVVNRLRYGMPDRYGHLTRLIVEHGCRSILEIGVWDAVHACDMIQAALRRHRPEAVTYQGLDLFEQATDDLVQREVSKSPRTLEAAQRKLRPLADRGVTVKLYQGNTLELLPALGPTLGPVDFVFLDGGHSYQTVRSDWQHVARLMDERTIVVFDDYVNQQALEREDYGINQVVEEIDPQAYRVTRLRPVDSFAKPWGRLEIAFVQVTRR